MRTDRQSSLAGSKYSSRPARRMFQLSTNRPEFSLIMWTGTRIPPCCTTGILAPPQASSSRSRPTTGPRLKDGQRFSTILLINPFLRKAFPMLTAANATSLPLTSLSQKSPELAGACMQFAGNNHICGGVLWDQGFSIGRRSDEFATRTTTSPRPAMVRSFQDVRKRFPPRNGTNRISSARLFDARL